jgi:hypothetical protein
VDVRVLDAKFDQAAVPGVGPVELRRGRVGFEALGRKTPRIARRRGRLLALDDDALDIPGSALAVGGRRALDSRPRLLGFARFALAA